MHLARLCGVAKRQGFVTGSIDPCDSQQSRAGALVRLNALVRARMLSLRTRMATSQTLFVQFPRTNSPLR